MHMTQGKVVSLLGAVAVAGLSLLGTTAAEAHGRGGRVVIRGGFGGWHGFGPYGWYGFNPFFAPYWAWGPGYGPGGGVDMNVAMMTGFGAVEMNVKPNRAEVWVDGKYVADARDLDGYPSYLWLEKGPHHIAVYKAGFKTFEDDIDVTRGVKRELKLRLEPGDSLPPGPRPADRERGNKEKSKDKGRETGGTGGEVD
jgi:hypothetical protein